MCVCVCVCVCVIHHGHRDGSMGKIEIPQTYHTPSSPCSWGTVSEKFLATEAVLEPSLKGGRQAGM